MSRPTVVCTETVIFMYFVGYTNPVLLKLMYLNVLQKSMYLFYIQTWWGGACRWVESVRCYVRGGEHTHFKNQWPCPREFFAFLKPKTAKAKISALQPPWASLILNLSHWTRLQQVEDLWLKFVLEGIIRNSTSGSLNISYQVLQPRKGLPDGFWERQKFAHNAQDSMRKISKDEHYNL